MNLSSSDAHRTAPGVADSALALLSHSPTLQRDAFLLSWVVAAEERSARQTLHLREAEERHEKVGVFYHVCVVRLVSVHAPPPLQKSASSNQPIATSKESEEACLAVPVINCGSAHPSAAVSSPLERLATAADGDEDQDDHVAAHDGDAAVDDVPSANPITGSFMKRLSDVELALARQTRPLYPLPLVSNGRAADALLSSCSLSSLSSPSHVSLDTCVALLDDLVASHSALSELSPSHQEKHPYNDVSEEQLLSFTSRRQRVLSVLALLRGALRSVQDAYTYATNGAAAASLSPSSPVSLDTLLQLPPDTLPLLMRTANGPPAWRALLTTTSLFTLWLTLTDSVALFTCMQSPVVDALWAAVLWMRTCALTPAVPAADINVAERKERVQHSPIRRRTSLMGRGVEADVSVSLPVKPSFSVDAKRRPSSVLSPSTRRTRSPRRIAAQRPSLPVASRAVQRSSPSRPRRLRCTDDAFDERWAYRDFPVEEARTAPTVYDALFPLPSATSVFTEPGGLPSNRRAAQREGETVPESGTPVLPKEGSSWEGKEDAAWLRGPGVDFYTGPSRRPQPL
ncbi:hypothetical protein ABB37_06156 [Leptomonas pyrrhocoris]|uniref:Uncharacterized protein n=1 Tax=Leptomonas pyrrhocoris TaxID=157538 RepID=A0A0M9FYM6_LEPPY|nr:hypothetical protein ABB37_06156 [Leptomonas pyrrhocoris]KPA78556.1 hypothetical protein ABB37_06156 [Leptomonas pyrrhocoris]|eukprot:XP_015656995.1 hypothetical protein ABB37_06156 [Leptomonas pyrrhocoris]